MNGCETAWTSERLRVASLSVEGREVAGLHRITPSVSLRDLDVSRIRFERLFWVRNFSITMQLH